MSIYFEIQNGIILFHVLVIIKSDFSIRIGLRIPADVLLINFVFVTLLENNNGFETIFVTTIILYVLLTLAKPNRK
jgi:hypothetical protein